MALSSDEIEIVSAKTILSQDQTVSQDLTTGGNESILTETKCHRYISSTARGK